MGPTAGPLLVPEMCRRYAGVDLVGSSGTRLTRGENGDPRVYCDGSTDPLMTASAPAGFASSNMTIMANNVSSPNYANAYNAICQKGDSSAYFEFFILASGKMAVYIYGGTSIGYYDGTGTYTLGTNVTNSIIVIYTDPTFICYVNGKQDGTDNRTSGVLWPADANPFAVGFDRLTAGRRFTGTIGDVRVYSYPLSAAQAANVSDPGTKFELWYPLRSKKWISIAAGSTFNAGWARGSNASVVGSGIHAS